MNVPFLGPFSWLFWGGGSPASPPRPCPPRRGAANREEKGIREEEGTFMFSKHEKMSVPSSLLSFSDGMRFRPWPADELTARPASVTVGCLPRRHFSPRSHGPART